jgi:ferrous iron transport protein A
MFRQKVSLSGSSLSLMKIGEEGTILRLKNIDQMCSQDLRKMGLIPGASIKLKQRSPTFIVKTGGTHLALDRNIAHAIYVRLAH